MCIHVQKVHKYYIVCIYKLCRSARGAGYSDDAQKRFINAKSISSDQYFGRRSEDDMVSHWSCAQLLNPQKEGKEHLVFNIL